MKRITRRNWRVRMVVVGLAAAACAGVGLPRATAEVPNVLAQAPADAQIVVVVPSLAAANRKIATLKAAWNVPSPEMDDVLGRMKSEMGATDGMDDNGSFMFVIPDVTKLEDASGQPAVLMFVPVSDYKAFCDNYAPQAAEGAEAPAAAPEASGISTLAMPGGRPAYAKQAGKYAVLSGVQSLVQAYQPAGTTELAAISTKLGPVGDTAVSGSDLFVYFNAEALAPALSPKIDEGLAQMQQQMQAAVGQGTVDQQTVELAVLQYKLYAQAAKAVLNDSTAFVLAFDVSDDALGISSTAQLKPGSATANLFPGGEATPAAVLADLPDRPYMFAMAMDQRAIDTGAIVDAVLEALPAAGTNDMVDMYRETLPMLTQITSFGGAFYPPDPNAAQAGQGGLLNGIYVYKTPDAEGFIKAVKKAFDVMNGVTVSMGPQGVMTYQTTYTDRALEIEGVAVDQYNLNMQMPPEVQQQMAMMMSMMFGGTGYGGYIAGKDGNVVLTTVTDPQLITSALRSAGKGVGLGTGPTIAEMRKQALPENAMMEGYLSLQGVAQAAAPMLMMFTGQQIAVPADLPPIAFGMGITSNGLSYRSYVPHKTVRFVVDEVSKAQQQMQQQQGQQPGNRPPY